MGTFAYVYVQWCVLWCRIEVEFFCHAESIVKKLCLVIIFCHFGRTYLRVQM